ncbi:MAG: molybdopterin cofactor-binding domain-containing protein [Planctomycetota bacterium]
MANAEEPAIVGVVRARVSRGRFGGLEAPLPDLPGVTLITAAEVPGELRLALHEGPLPVLSHRKIRYRGQPLALVVAPDAATLELALAGITAEQTAQIPVEDLHRSQQASVRLFGHDNVFAERRATRGDPDAAFAAAETLVTASFGTAMQDPFEPDLARVRARRLGDGLEVEGSFLEPARVARHLASLLGIPADRVAVSSSRPRARVAADDSSVLLPAAHAALAAWVDGRPVEFQLSRPESLAFQPKRPAAEIRVTVAADRAGALGGLDLDARFDGGAFPLSAAEIVDEALLAAQSAYRVRDLRVRVRVLATSSAPNGGVRGTASSAVTFAVERAVDALADRLRVEPRELRRRSLARGGDHAPDGRRLSFGEEPAHVLARAREALPPETPLACFLWPTRNQDGPRRRLRLRLVAKGADLEFAHLACPEIALSPAARDDLAAELAGRFGLRENRLLIGGVRVDEAAAPELEAALRARVRTLFDRVGADAAAVGARLAATPDGVWCDEIPFDDGPVSALRVAEVGVVAAEVECDDLSCELRPRRLDVFLGATRVTRDARRELGGAVAIAIGATVSEEVLVEFGGVANASSRRYQPPRLGDLPVIAVEGAPRSRAHRDPEEWWDWGGAAVPAVLAAAAEAATGVRISDLPVSPEMLVERARGRTR